MAFQLIDLVHY